MSGGGTSTAEHHTESYIFPWDLPSGFSSDEFNTNWNFIDSYFLKIEKNSILYVKTQHIREHEVLNFNTKHLKFKF